MLRNVNPRVVAILLKEINRQDGTFTILIYYYNSIPPLTSLPFRSILSFPLSFALSVKKDSTRGEEGVLEDGEARPAENPECFYCFAVSKAGSRARL